MKGCSRRNMGETYHGVSQPSDHEASYKKFSASAAVVATRVLPSVIKPPHAQPGAPVCLFGALFISSHSLQISLINIQPPASGMLSPPVQDSFIRALFSFLSPFNLISISFFSSRLLGLTLINVLMYSCSHDGAETRCRCRN